MGKGKPRHHPEKRANQKGWWCQGCEEIDGKLYCEGGYGDTEICKGNPHNCIKTFYHAAASLSDKQKMNGEIPHHMQRIKKTQRKEIMIKNECNA